MGIVHDIIERNGKQGALLADLTRSEVEAAAAYLSDESDGIGFLYSGWCQAALPHKRLSNDADWQIKNDRLTLIVEPGRKPGPGDKAILVGVPYGSRARLIMLYLQSEALRTRSRDVALGRSMREWLTKMGIPRGGKSIDDVREQAERISRCRLTFHMTAGGGRSGLINQNIVDTALFLDTDENQGSLFVETARLSESFYAQLQKHPVPLEDAAIRAINNNSMALDIYAWLAYRLHVLSKPTPVQWRNLKPQFGVGYSRLDNFKMRFIDNLRLALAVYRGAKVDVEDRCLILHPSRPPVTPKIVGLASGSR